MKNKTWNDFTKEELIDIAKMLSQVAYGSIDLNFNDTFFYASAYGVECDEFDLIAVSELFKNYGYDGVLAWAAIKENCEPLKLSRYPKYHEAYKEIKSNKDKYFWQIRIKSKSPDLSKEEIELFEKLKKEEEENENN